MLFNSGVSASGAGADQAMFAVWKFDDNAFPSTRENFRIDSHTLFEDSGNCLDRERPATKGYISA